MGFGNIFSKSWNEFFSNFKIFFKTYLILYVIPTLLFLISLLPFIIKIAKSVQGVQAGTVSDFSSIFGGSISSWIAMLIPAGVLWLVLIVLAIFMTIIFINISFSKDKKNMSFKQAWKSSSKFFGRGVVLIIALFFALLGLFLLLIIPAIIFSIFWVFSFYVMIQEKKRVGESMKTSHDLVRGKWWKVFGYVLLMSLIVWLISFIFSIGAFIINFIISLILGVSASSPITLASVSMIINAIFRLGASLISMPLIIIFMKNFYLELKAQGVVKKKEKKK